MGSINQFLRELGSGTSIKDFKHASKIFVDDNYRLSPKYTFLFHVAFDLNPELSRTAMQHPLQVLEAGMLVKSVQLPKYTIDTKTYNAYNRVNIVQNKLKYDAVNIEFHDDSADVIRNLWYDYMSYYYRDTDYTTNFYQQSHKYNERGSTAWGYQPARYGSNANSVERMLNSIRIYSLHQKKFSEYILVNPTITSFQHGEHQNSSNEIMKHSMTVNFETVLYAGGYVVPDSTMNFAMLHYDNEPSPLTPQGGGTLSILGPGGLMAAADSVIDQLGQDPPNILGAAFTAFKSAQNFKGANLGAIAGAGLAQIGRNVLTGNNPLQKLQIPSISGGLIGAIGKLGKGGLGGLAAGGIATVLKRGGPMGAGGATSGVPVQSAEDTGVLFENEGYPDEPGSDLAVSGVASSNGEDIAETDSYYSDEYSDSQMYAGADTNINDDSSLDLPSDQGDIFA